MRFPFLCTFLLAFTLTAPAQETFAPLITDNTVLFVHVDLRKADVDAFKQNWTQYSEGLLKSLNFDAASLRASMSALNRDLDRFDEFIRPAVETITKELGIQEIAAFVDTTLLDENYAHAVFAVIPWKGKTDADWKKFQALLPEDTELHVNLLVKGDFIFATNCWSKEVVEEWFDNLKPAANDAMMQALKSLNESDDIKIAAAMTDSARESLLNALKEASDVMGFPEQVMNMFTFIARKVDWVATSFPNPLLTPAVMEGMALSPKLKLTVKTRAANDAKMLRSMLDTSIDLGITAWKTAMMVMETEDMPKTPEFFYAISRGYLRTLLPEVEGDKLIFHYPDMDGRFMELYYVWYAGFLHQLFTMMNSQMNSFMGGDDESFEIGSEFKLYGRTIQDKEFDWDSYRSKYVLVKFTATWCGPCKFEVPGMLTAYEKYHDKGLEIVSVYIWEEDGDEGNEDIKKFVEKEKLPWTIISEPLTEKAGGDLQSETFGEGIKGVPTMLIVDKDGKVFATETRGAKLQQVLKTLFE